MLRTKENRSPGSSSGFQSHIFIFSVYLFLGLFLLPVIAFARESKAVRIGYYENDNFQSGAGEGLAKRGYSYEYMSRLQIYTDWKYEYVYGEYGVLYEKLLRGEIDILTGLAYKTDREGLIGYPELAMGDTPYYFLKRSADTAITSDPASLDGVKIGVLRGAMEEIVAEYLRRNRLSAETILFDDLQARDDALRDQSVDIIIVEGSTTEAMDGIEAYALAGSADYYVCTNIERPDILADLNDGQAKLFKANPNLKQELYDQWLRQNAVSATLTEAEHQWLDAHKTFTIGYFSTYLPYSASDAQGNATGLVKDVVPELFSTLKIDGIQFEYKGYASYKDMITALQAGEITAAFPVYSDIWACENIGIKPTNPVITTYYDLIFRGQYSDFSTASFALRETNSLPQAFKSVLYPDNPILFYDTVQDCLDALVEEQADVTIINGLRTDYYLRSKDSYRKLSSVQIAADVPLSFAVSPYDAGTMEILNHGISLMDKDFALTHSYQYEEKHQITPIEFLRENSLMASSIFSALALLIILFVVWELYKNRKYVQLQLEQKKELETAKKEAEDANKAKTSFLFNMSHDIRTPMNAIMGFRNLLEKEQDDPEKRSYYLKKIDESSKVLLSIINNVLEMARIEKGTLALTETAWSVEQFNDSLYSVFADMMRQKGIAFTRTIEIEHRYVFCDATKLREVFLNILSNACKYTDSGGAVSMHLKEIPCEKAGWAMYQTTIRDTGIGMSAEYLPHLFEEFTREETSTSSKIEGTGLGMPIVKRLVDFMDGTIEVSSTKGVGTTFAVTIPHKIADKSDLTEISGVVIDEKLFKGKRILLAEDIAVNAEIAKAILTDVGFIIDHAEDGQICLDKLMQAADGYYDLILMDIQMPHMNGYEAARAIRALNDTSKARIPILAMTANAFEEDKREAKNAGMDGHIAKPIDLQALMKELARVLSS